uniref:Right handed beta helix domain-containing protein n=1 Tax=Ciona savignyi TaxID=51511 RepID=H2YGZ6_CIOSA
MVKNVNITNSVFSDIGNIAVTVEYNNDPTNTFAPRDILIEQNTFVGCGVYSMYQPTCVHVKGVRNIVVTRNDISRSSYAGIRVGWQKVFTRDYVTPGEYVFYVTRNNVHHYGNGIMNDFAGVYLSSNMPDCGIAQNMSICHIHALISENTIHHSEAYYYGAIGVYTDTAASSVTVTRNWIYKLSDCAVNFHCGQNDIAVNNMIYHTSPKRVFGVCNPSVGDDGRMPRQVMTFERNVIYVGNTNARLYGRGDFWENDMPKVDWNTYFFKPSDFKQFTKFFCKTMTPTEWVENAKNDGNSAVADPLFRNISSDDYRLHKTSPAFKQGIESVDLRHVLLDSGAC